MYASGAGNFILRRLENKKADVTITCVTSNLKLKRSKISRAFKQLEELKLIKRAGKGRRLIFFKVISINGESKPVFGNSLEVYLESNLEKLKTILVQEEYLKLKKLRTENLNKYFLEQNPIVEGLWTKNFGQDLKKFEFSTKAIRYHIA